MRGVYGSETFACAKYARQRLFIQQQHTAGGIQASEWRGMMRRWKTTRTPCGNAANPCRGSLARQTAETGLVGWCRTHGSGMERGTRYDLEDGLRERVGPVRRLQIQRIRQPIARKQDPARYGAARR